MTASTGGGPTHSRGRGGPLKPATSTNSRRRGWTSSVPRGMSGPPGAGALPRIAQTLIAARRRTTPPMSRLTAEEDERFAALCHRLTQARQGGHPMTTRRPLADKVEIQGLIDSATSWDLSSAANLPAPDVAAALAEQLTQFGTVAAQDLDRQCATLPPDLPTVVEARATLTEAGRRFTPMPLPANAPQQRVAQRVQNLARMVQAVNRASARVNDEHDRRRHTGRPPVQPRGHTSP